MTSSCGVKYVPVSVGQGCELLGTGHEHPPPSLSSLQTPICSSFLFQIHGHLFISCYTHLCTCVYMHILSVVCSVCTVLLACVCMA